MGRIERALQLVIVDADVLIAAVLHLKALWNGAQMHKAQALIQVAGMDVVLHHGVELEQLEPGGLALHQRIGDQLLADVLILKGLCDDNVDFTAGLQAHIDAQGGLILDVESIPVGVQIVIHALEELQIVWRAPVVHLLAQAEILIPGQGGGIVRVIGDEPELGVDGSAIQRDRLLAGWGSSK